MGLLRFADRHSMEKWALLSPTTSVHSVFSLSLFTTLPQNCSLFLSKSLFFTLCSLPVSISLLSVLVIISFPLYLPSLTFSHLLHTHSLSLSLSLSTLLWCTAVFWEECVWMVLCALHFWFLWICLMCPLMWPLADSVGSKSENKCVMLLQIILSA